MLTNNTADNFAAAAQMLSNSRQSRLSEKISGRQLFEVNEDGSIRKQTFGEQLKSFGLRLVRQFDAHANTKDAQVGQALNDLYSKLNSGSSYRRNGSSADLNGLLGRFFVNTQPLPSRQPFIPAPRPPAALPTSSEVRNSRASDYQEIPAERTNGSIKQGLPDSASSSTELVRSLNPQASDQLRRAELMRPDADQTDVQPGFVRQNKDGSFPDTAIGSNGRSYQLNIHRGSPDKARTALAWVNAQVNSDLNGRNTTMIERALTEAGITERFDIHGRKVRALVERPGILSEITPADKRRFERALSQLQAKALSQMENARTQSAAQATYGKPTYGAQMFDEMQSVRSTSPVRPEVASSVLRGNVDAIERAYLLYDEYLADKLTEMAYTDKRLMASEPTQLTVADIDEVIGQAIHDAGVEFKLIIDDEEQAV